MGIFNLNRKKEQQSVEDIVNSYFKTISGYTPSFRTYEGSLYEMDLCRSAINSFATHCSKLKPQVLGSGNEALNNILAFKPNPLQDTSKFLYKIATMLEVDNTCFIAPIFDNTATRIVGFYPLLAENCELRRDSKGNYWIRYRFSNEKYGAVELEKCGILNKFQFKDEIFGSTNHSLAPTLNLINMNNQGIVEGIKNGASLRFMAKISQTLKPEAIESERKRFTESNLSSQNNGGVMIYDGKYEDVKQIQSQPYLVDDKQQQIIKNNVFNYFGVNENIIQNKYTSAEWNAFYEGKIEPFALQLGLTLTNMCFNQRERAFGNEVIVTANRMQYLEPSEKLQVVTSLFDRGMLTQNQGLEIFNLPNIGAEGDVYYIRKEYVDTSNVEKTTNEDLTEDAEENPISNDDLGDNSNANEE